jgi:hypothetical protein
MWFTCDSEFFATLGTGPSRRVYPACRRCLGGAVRGMCRDAGTSWLKEAGEGHNTKDQAIFPTSELVHE